MLLILASLFVYFTWLIEHRTDLPLCFCGIGMESEKDNKDGGTAVVAPKQEKPEQKKKPGQLPPFHVVLLNDDDHTYEYVVEMLKALFGHPDEMGFTIAKEVND